MCKKLEQRIEDLEEQLQALSALKKEYLNLEEATAVFGWSRRKLFFLRDDGTIKFYRFPNTRRRYIKRSEVEADFIKDEVESV